MPEKRTHTIRLDDDGNVSQRDRFLRWLGDSLELFADGRAVITIERPKRTLGQNRYYWGYIIRPIRRALRDAGYRITDEALHEHFKEMFLGVEGSYEYVDKETGEVHEITQGRSTTDLDQTQFDRYVEAIRTSELVRQLEVYLPRPGDPDELFQEAKADA
jgi:hypothetical protein